MGLDVLAFAKSKKYTDETIDGAGAVKGKNCIINSILSVAGGQEVTFSWTMDDGTVKTQTMFVPDGQSGPQGIQGEQGPQGIRGEKGLKGDQGEPGEQGPPGTIGPQGIQGEQGPQGLTGPQGIQGEKGDTGEQGPQGIQGIQGIQGPKGEDGYPFLIYKEYSDISEFNPSDFPEIGLMFMINKPGTVNKPVYRYTGEAGVWYSHVTDMSTAEGLKGDKGDKGDQGEQGIQGEPGLNGSDGTTYTPSIGTVETVDDRSQASVTVEVDSDTKQAVFNFSIPHGAKGLDGNGIVSVFIDADNHLICRLTDGNELDAGPIDDVSVVDKTETGIVAIYDTTDFYGDTFDVEPTGTACVSSGNFLKIEKAGTSELNHELNVGETLEINGVSILLNEDGSVLLNGTPVSDFYIFFNITKAFRESLINNRVKISLFTSDNTPITLTSGIEFDNSGYPYSLTRAGSHEGLVTGDMISSSSRLDLRTNNTYNNVIVSAMLEIDSERGYFSEYAKSDAIELNGKTTLNVADYAFVGIVGEHVLSYRIEKEKEESALIEEIDKLKELNPLHNVTVACIGDSLCYGQGYSGGYAAVLSELEPDVTIVNLAVGGAMISSNHQSGGNWVIENQLDKLDEAPDFILAEGYVNDYLTNVAIGSMIDGFDGPFDTATFYGGMESLLRKLTHTFSGTRYGFIITHEHYYAAASTECEKYLTAIKECCNKWGVPYLDLSNLISPLIPVNNTAYYTDGLHYNESGYRMITPSIREWLKHLTPNERFGGLEMRFEDLTDEQIEAIRGPQGEKGEKGDTGPQGPQGIQGEKGEKGDTGPQGPQGPQGDTTPIDDQTPSFTTATTRVNITSKEKLSVMLGKIAKFFTDLKTVAFSGSYVDLSNKPSIPVAVAVKGNVETSYRTGNVNLTPANIGAAEVESGTCTLNLIQYSGGTSVIAQVSANYVKIGTRVTLKFNFNVNQAMVDATNLFIHSNSYPFPVNSNGLHMGAHVVGAPPSGKTSINIFYPSTPYSWLGIDVTATGPSVNGFIEYFTT